MSKSRKPTEFRKKAEYGPDRRGVLKSVAAGATALAGLSGTASAAEMSGPVSVETSDDIRSVLSNHESLLNYLSSRGLLESSSVDELTIDPKGATRADGDEEIKLREKDGRMVKEIQLHRQTDEGRLEVIFQPTACLVESSLIGPGGEVEIIEEPGTHYNWYCCGETNCDEGGCECTEWCSEQLST